METGFSGHFSDMTSHYEIRITSYISPAISMMGHASMIDHAAGLMQFIAGVSASESSETEKTNERNSRLPR